MTAFFAYLREFHLLSVICRLLLALAIGGVLGYGRTRKRQAAGLRTYMLVSLGAALTILISLYEHEMLSTEWAYMAAVEEVKFDAVRFSAQVVTGIGFLAAGTIIAAPHQQVSGLTTAIGLFAAACLGIAAGSGFFEVVLIALLLILLVMDVLHPLELAFKRRLRNITLYVEYEQAEDIADITALIRSRQAQIFELEFERQEREGELYPAAIFSLQLSREAPSHSGMLSSLAEMNCVHSIQELIS